MVNDTLFGFTMQGHGTPRQHELLHTKEEGARAVVLDLTQEILQRSLEAEVTRQLGEPRSRRSDAQIAWHCRRCGTRLQRHIRRNGHYRRRLTVREGTISLRVPEIRCRCGGYADVAWDTLTPRLRYWIDVELDSIRHYLAGTSYRLVADAASTQSRVHISHLQGWRAMQRAGGTGREKERGKGKPNLGPCPRAVILDDVHVPVAGEDLVFLIAVTHDGRVLLLDGPTSRTTGSWAQALECLSDHGIGPGAGLVAAVADGDSAIREAVALVWPRVVMQRCVWHILDQVAHEVVEVYGPESPDGERIVEEARRIFWHDRRKPGAMAEAARLLQAFLAAHKGQRWAETVRRAFVEGTEYLRTPGVPRTNGRAERVIRELRRRTKVMDGFKSKRGAAHFAVIWSLWNNERRRLAHERRQLQRPRNLKTPHPHPKLP
ncbi:MAG: transposase [Chloroflexota bacterium]